MPQLLLIAASGTAQRRLLEETAAALEKEGYTAAGKQEGGEWNSLLSDNMTGGLFDEKRFVVVESAFTMGAFPEKLASVVEPQSDVILLLVYESDAKAQPSKFIPKDVLSKCRVVKPVEFPRWPRERQAWVTRLAGELEAPLTAQGAAMIVELLDDPEEIRAQLKSLKLLKKNGAIDAADVRQMCLDDGSRNLLRLLDGLCTGDAVGVVKSLRAMSSSPLPRCMEILTDDPAEEIRAAKAILKAAGLRKDGVNIVACPTCGRTRIDLIGLAKQVEEALADCKKPITVAVMGCVVNGPGEAREADVGIAGGEDCGILFVKGEQKQKLPYDQLLPALLSYIEQL